MVLKRICSESPGPSSICLVLILLSAAGLAACDLSRAPVLEEIRRFDTSGWAHDIRREAGRLYVADRQGGIAVFEPASAWRAPEVLSPAADVISLAPHGGAPVAAARFEGLVLAGRDGKPLSRVTLGDIANAAVCRGDLVFAAYGLNGLVVARIEEGDLRLLSRLPTPGWSHDIKLAGNRALLADWDYGLRVIDVSDPEHPVEVGHLETPATAICSAPARRDGAEIAAIAEGHGGVALAVFDSAGRPRLLSRHPLGLNPADEPHPKVGGWAHGVAWSGRYLLVADWKQGLEVLDTKDLLRPRLIARVPSLGTSLAVAAEPAPDGTSLVYLADGEAGLRIFRFTPP